MTTVPQPNSLGSSYDLTFDAWNRLVKVEDGATTVAEYEYDGLNRRITKDVSGTVRHFFYSDQWQVAEERVGADTDPADHYVWGLRYVDDLILRDRDTASIPDGSFNQRHYYLQDANFNVTGIIDHSGSVQERYLYEPYGEAGFLTSAWASSTSNYDTQYLFTGRRLDDETKIYQYRYGAIKLSSAGSCNAIRSTMLHWTTAYTTVCWRPTDDAGRPIRGHWMYMGHKR